MRPPQLTLQRTDCQMKRKSLVVKEQEALTQMVQGVKFVEGCVFPVEYLIARASLR